MSGGKIRQRTATCQQLFTQCLSLEHFEPTSWFEMRRGEFNLWAYGLRALSAGKSSLDYRVRNRSDIGGILQALLGGLAEDLGDCITIDRDLSSNATRDIAPPELGDQGDVDFDFVELSDDEADSESSGSIQEEGPFSFQIHNIRMVIAQLTRFSSLIRRSGTKFRFERADSELGSKLDDETSELSNFREYLTNMVLIRNIKYDGGKLLSPEDLQAQMNPDLLSPVQRRLIHGGLLRRNRILEATKNLKPEAPRKREAILQPTQYLDLHIPPIEPPAPIPVSSNKAQSRTGATVKSNEQSKVESTTKTATEIGSQLGLQVAPPNAAPSVMTKVTRTGTTQDYPKCPKPISDDFLQCPYCADMLPVSYRDHNSRWRGHVAQDVLPYMCIYEQCPLADEMYLTSEELVSHVREYHGMTVWSCNYCLQTSSEDQTFETAEKWQEHMQQAHQDAVPVKQLQSLARVSERQVVQAVACPLCAYTPVGIQTTVDQHILQHLHEFSLWSLPSGVGDSAQSSTSDSSVDVHTDTDLEDLDENEWQEWHVDSGAVAFELHRLIWLWTENFQSVEGFDLHLLHRLHLNSPDKLEQQRKLEQLSRQYPEMMARVHKLIQQAYVSLSEEAIETDASSYDGLSMGLSIMRGLQVELETLDEVPIAERHSRNTLTTETPKDYKSLPLRFPQPFTRPVRPDDVIIKELGDFAFDQEDGFAALVQYDVYEAHEQTNFFAQASLKNHPDLRMFWLDLKTFFDDHGFIQGIGRLDKAFAQIATELLEMSEILKILAEADRGSGLVEAILRIMNTETKVRWIIFIENLTMPVGEFLLHDAKERGCIELPAESRQGSVIITSEIQRRVPEALNLHLIPSRSEPPRAGRAANSDPVPDNIFSPAEFARLQKDPSLGLKTQEPSTERRGPTLNVIHATPPPSPGLGIGGETADDDKRPGGYLSPGDRGLFLL